MRYFLAHVDDRPVGRWQESDPHEEIYVLPYGERVVTAVELGALRHALPVLHERSALRPPACCPGCGAQLPAAERSDSR